MTTVTIHDEATRAVIEAVLWIRGSHEIPGEFFDDPMTDIADALMGRPMRDYEDSLAQVEQGIDVLIQLRATVNRLRGTRVGASFEIPFGDDEVRYCVEGYSLLEVVRGYADSGYSDGGFWNQSPQVRDALLATHDAAVRLLSELSPAEAVA